MRSDRTSMDDSRQSPRWVQQVDMWWTWNSKDCMGSLPRFRRLVIGVGQNRWSLVFRSVRAIFVCLVYGQYKLDTDMKSVAKQVRHCHAVPQDVVPQDVFPI